MAVAATDNYEYQVRRKRLGLKQRDVARALGVAISAVSDFEAGARDNLPHGLTAKDYDRYLTAGEKAARGAK